jgi:hypothetical protein
MAATHDYLISVGTAPVSDHHWMPPRGKRYHPMHRRTTVIAPMGSTRRRHGSPGPTAARHAAAPSIGTRRGGAHRSATRTSEARALLAVLLGTSSRRVPRQTQPWLSEASERRHGSVGSERWQPSGRHAAADSSRHATAGRPVRRGSSDGSGRRGSPWSAAREEASRAVTVRPRPSTSRRASSGTAVGGSPTRDAAGPATARTNRRPDSRVSSANYGRRPAGGRHRAPASVRTDSRRLRRTRNAVAGSGPRAIVRGALPVLLFMMICATFVGAWFTATGAASFAGIIKP